MENDLTSWIPISSTDITEAFLRKQTQNVQQKTIKSSFQNRQNVDIKVKFENLEQVHIINPSSNIQAERNLKALRDQHLKQYEKLKKIKNMTLNVFNAMISRKLVSSFKAWKVYSKREKDYDKFKNTARSISRNRSEENRSSIQQIRFHIQQNHDRQYERSKSAERNREAYIRETRDNQLQFRIKKVKKIRTQSTKVLKQQQEKIRKQKQQIAQELRQISARNDESIRVERKKNYTLEKLKFLKNLK